MKMKNLKKNQKILPNGKYVESWIFFLFSSLNLSGSNLSGLGKYLGSLKKEINVLQNCWHGISGHDQSQNNFQ